VGATRVGLSVRLWVNSRLIILHAAMACSEKSKLFFCNNFKRCGHISIKFGNQLEQRMLYIKTIHYVQYFIILLAAKLWQNI